MDPPLTLEKNSNISGERIWILGVSRYVCNITVMRLTSYACKNTEGKKWKTEQGNETRDTGYETRGTGHCQIEDIGHRTLDTGSLNTNTRHRETENRTLGTGQWTLHAHSALATGHCMYTGHSTSVTRLLEIWKTILTIRGRTVSGKNFCKLTNYSFWHTFGRLFFS